MDAEDRQPGGHGHRKETSLLPLKKRASNYMSNPGRISSSAAAAAGDPPHGSSSSSKTKKKRTAVAVGAAETKDKDTTGAFDAPVPRQRRSVPAAAASREPQPQPEEPKPAAEEEELPAPPAAEAEAASPSPEPAAEGDDSGASSDDDEKWLSKGKWLAPGGGGGDSSTPAPVEKLMQDGVRCYVPQQLRHAADGELSEAVWRRLVELRAATRPWLLLRKSLSTSDVDDNQNRLLLSCKRDDDWRHHPITRCFSADELRRVVNKYTGLWVTALDGGVVVDGAAGGGAGGGGVRSYDITCKFLGSNSGYRFIGGWKEFLAGHGMNLKSQPRLGVWSRHVDVEFWAFRSRRLPFQPEVGADGRVAQDEVEVDENERSNKKKKKDSVKVDRFMKRHLHPDGELGLVLVLRENVTRRVEHDEEEDGDDGEWEGPPSPPTAKVAARSNKGKQRSGKRAALPAAAAPAAEAVPAPVAAEEGGGGEWEAMSESEQMRWGAIGLVNLRESTLAEWREQVGRGRGGEEGSSDGVAKPSAQDVEEDDREKIEKPGNANHKKGRGGE